MEMAEVPYTFVRKGMPTRDNTYPEPSPCGLGGSQFTSSPPLSPLVIPPGAQSLLSGKREGKRKHSADAF